MKVLPRTPANRALVQAIVAQDPNGVRQALKEGAAAHLVCDAFNTPLLECVLRRFEAGAHLLLEAGANPWDPAEPNRGRIPTEEAARMGQDALLRLFITHQHGSLERWVVGECAASMQPSQGTALHVAYMMGRALTGRLESWVFEIAACMAQHPEVLQDPQNKLSAVHVWKHCLQTFRTEPQLFERLAQIIPVPARAQWEQAGVDPLWVVMDNPWGFKHFIAQYTLEELSVVNMQFGTSQPKSFLERMLGQFSHMQRAPVLAWIAADPRRQSTFQRLCFERHYWRLPAREGSLAQLRDLMKVSGTSWAALKDWHDGRGDTLLHHVCSKSHEPARRERCIRSLLKRGWLWQQPNFHQETALHLLCSEGISMGNQAHALRLLQVAHETAAPWEAGGMTPLRQLAQTNATLHAHVQSWLLKDGMDPALVPLQPARRARM